MSAALLLLAVLAFDRGEWRHWSDADRDCQSTRQEVLIAEGEGVELDGRGCRVVGGRWVDPYSGEVVEDPGLLDVDHLVPLKNAWESGGWAWDAERREQYANELGHPEHLVAVHRSLNRQKGAKGPEEWMPPVGRCEYLRHWVGVKERWGLRMTVAEARYVYLDSGCRW